MDIDINDLPAYREAVEQEALVRDTAFLGLPEYICGLRVRPMTVRHLLWLELVKSPFVCARTIEPSEIPLHVEAFALIVAVRDPKPTFGGWLRRRLFLRRYRKWARRTPIGEAIAGVRGYVGETFQDASSGRGCKSYFSLAANVANWLMQDCHLPGTEAVNTALDMPLKIVFQLMRAGKLYHNPKAVVFNQSEGVLSRILTGLEEYQRDLSRQPATDLGARRSEYFNPYN